MKKLKRLRVSGNRIPNFVVWLKGAIHGKKGMADFEGEHMVIRSPYLYERRNRYVEYKERLLREAEILVEPLQKEILREEAKRQVDVEKLKVTNSKLEILKYPMSGNECRAKLQLAMEKNSLELSISESDAKIKELSEQELLIQSLTMHLLEENLSKLRAKAYVYVTGVRTSRKSRGLYLQAEDSIKESFQDLLPVNV